MVHNLVYNVYGQRDPVSPILNGFTTHWPNRSCTSRYDQSSLPVPESGPCSRRGSAAKPFATLSRESPYFCVQLKIVWEREREREGFTKRVKLLR